MRFMRVAKICWITWPKDGPRPIQMAAAVSDARAEAWAIVLAWVAALLFSCPAYST